MIEVNGLQVAKRVRRAQHAVPLLTIFVAVLGLGCGRSKTVEQPGTVNFLIETMPINLDPRIGTDAQSQHLDGLLFNSLVAHDDADEYCAGPC